ncbi:glutamine--tRNA ligase-like protein [Tanacetum coccineum]
MEAKSFEEGLTEARQDFSLARQDFTLASEKFHRSIKAAIKEETNQEGQVDFLGVQLNQQSPNRKVKARRARQDISLASEKFHRSIIVAIKEENNQEGQLNRLVTKNYVDGWDDPHLMTLAGLRRRGVTSTAINTFLEESISREGCHFDGSMIRLEHQEHHVRDELNKPAPHTIVVLHPLKVVITNLEPSSVIDLDAKKWLGAPNDDASSCYKVECWHTYDFICIYSFVCDAIHIVDVFVSIKYDMHVIAANSFCMIKEEGGSEGGVVVQVLLRVTIGLDSLISTLKLRGTTYNFTQQKVILQLLTLFSLCFWCESFDTYRRTYDLLHLFSVEQKRNRCCPPLEEHVDLLIGAARLCFYAYVVVSGGNPPPKKLKAKAAVAALS